MHMEREVAITHRQPKELFLSPRKTNTERAGKQINFIRHAHPSHARPSDLFHRTRPFHGGQSASKLQEARIICLE
jgi:hypothetical protein